MYLLKLIPIVLNFSVPVALGVQIINSHAPHQLPSPPPVEEPVPHLVFGLPARVTARLRLQHAQKVGLAEPVHPTVVEPGGKSLTFLFQSYCFFF